MNANCFVIIVSVGEKPGKFMFLLQIVIAKLLCYKSWEKLKSLYSKGIAIAFHLIINNPLELATTDKVSNRI